MPGEFIALDPRDLGGGQMYHLLNAIIAPRPIAWVSSVGPNGVFNIAPHSYTTVFSPDPPIVGFVSVGRKDTVRNVEATREFVYHIADESLAERLNRSAADFPPDQSEFTWAGLTAVRGDIVGAPRAIEAPVAMEVRLVEVIEIAKTGNLLVLGEVVRVHLADRIMSGDRVDPALLRPLGRLAGSQFSRLGDLFSLDRPTFRGLVAEGTGPMGKGGTAS